MTQQPNAMVPETNWAGAAKQFANQQGRQSFLCARCVLDLGMTTPPEMIVLHEGESLCLDHLPRPEIAP